MNLGPNANGDTNAGDGRKTEDWSPLEFELTSYVRASLLAWLKRRYVCIVDEWVTAIDLQSSDYGTHSLPRTKAAMIYKATGSLRAIQILLGHTKIENTVRYLGVDIEDALLLAERTGI